MGPYLEKIHHRKGLVEWLKVEALSSNPSATHTKKACTHPILPIIEFSVVCGLSVSPSRSFHEESRYSVSFITVPPAGIKAHSRLPRNSLMTVLKEHKKKGVR
jgi:hypothetical protein